MCEVQNDIYSENKSKNKAIESQDNAYPWYAVRVLTHKQKDVVDCLNEHGLETFVPTAKVDYEDKNGNLQHAIKPVIHNFAFVKKNKSERAMRLIFNSVPHPISIIRKSDKPQEYYNIPAKQMNEFRMMSDVMSGEVKFLEEEAADIKEGKEVLVKFGPMKGLTGKLVRQSKKYYLLKEIPGIAVMVKVSRWCCVGIDEQ